MSLQNIINTILDEAKNKAKRVKDEAVKKIKEIEKECKAKAKEEEERILDETKAEQDRILDEAKFEARLSAKNKSLAKKQELIDKVFEIALDKLTKLSKDDYSKLLVSLLKQLPELEGRVEIVAVKDREKTTEEAIRKAKRDFILSQEVVEAEGGFVLRSQDIEIDNTFGTLLKEKREELETKIAQVLFK